MKTYTKKQLIKAQQKWNKEALVDPYNFEKDLQGTKKFATKQIEYLISLTD